MKHDELLEKVNQGELGWFYGWMQDALRAVVELHKPIETTPPWAYEKYLACNVCLVGTNDGDYNLDYPCPTIQAIEKELQ